MDVEEDVVPVVEWLLAQAHPFSVQQLQAAHRLDFANAYVLMTELVASGCLVPVHGIGRDHRNDLRPSCVHVTDR